MNRNYQIEQLRKRLFRPEWDDPQLDQLQEFQDPDYYTPPLFNTGDPVWVYFMENSSEIMEYGEDQIEFEDGMILKGKVVNLDTTWQLGNYIQYWQAIYDFPSSVFFAAGDERKYFVLLENGSVWLFLETYLKYRKK